MSWFVGQSQSVSTAQRIYEWKCGDREREGVQRGALSFVYWLSVRLLTAAGQCRARESHSPSSIYSSVDRLFSILIQCTHYDIIGLAVNG